MKNLKIGEISSSGQKQGENTKIGKFPRKSERLGSYDNTWKQVLKMNICSDLNFFISIKVLSSIYADIL